MDQTSRVQEVEKLKHFESGATRSKDVEPYNFHLIPGVALKREARIWKEGADTHGPENWKGGFGPNSISVCLDHLTYHLSEYLDGDRSEDHIAKIVVNSQMIMWFEANLPMPSLSGMAFSGGVAAQIGGSVKK